MRDRHWHALGAAVGAPAGVLLPATRSPLRDLLALDLPRHADAVAAAVDRARRELAVEQALARIDAAWAAHTLTFSPHAGTGVLIAAIPPALADGLETDVIALQNLASGRLAQANAEFGDRVRAWRGRLAGVDAVLTSWTAAQRKWVALQAIFTGSADLRASLPGACARFDAGDAAFRAVAADAPSTPLAVDAAAVPGRGARLEDALSELETAEKALQGYLEAKRVAFPRFYFVSPADLLDVLSRGADPHAVVKYLPKIFDNVHALQWAPGVGGKPSTTAVALVSGEGEVLPLASPCECTGPVEVWLGRLVTASRAAVAAAYRAALPTYAAAPSRAAWALAQPAQIATAVSRTYYASAVGIALRDAEAGDAGALAGEAARQRAQLAELVTAIDGPLPANDRKKLITLCTLDVHARDVVAGLAAERADSPDCFAWASQLRYYAHPTTQACVAHICDSEIEHGCEYVGNVGTLCVTPLTDRCYITLAQARKLILGGAPAGPAGTGKTETTKDLARALGVQCYVFNCSAAMDARALGATFRGLASTGAWGCFDEFNRISVGVLSVCSTQYRAVLDAQRAGRTSFLLDGAPTALVPGAMAFITMNPGYAGRAELPESLRVRGGEGRRGLGFRRRARPPPTPSPLSYRPSSAPSL